MENKISGVYKITNNITGDFYIGSSKNIKHRWSDHKCPSMWVLQPNSKLYQDMAQYDIDNFLFEIIEETANLKEREQYWIDLTHPTYNNYQVNRHDTERYKEWKNRICLYNGETLTFNALINRLYKQKTPNAVTEAKKYLLEK